MPGEMSGQGDAKEHATPFGPFVLERRLAVGGSAEVFLARPKTGLMPAPKLVVKRLLAGKNESQFDVLDHEAELNRAVSHPNVVTVFGAGMVGQEPYLAMEYVEGVDLYRLLRHLETEQLRLPLGVAIYITRRLTAALAAVHSACNSEGVPLAIVHRDVTPSNVYLSVDGAVKLGDFGIARVSEAIKPATMDGGLKGKFGYLAPEQIAGEPFDHRADLFALTAILGEMLLGERVFPGSGQLAVLLAIRDANIEPLRSRSALMPPGLFAIFERALARAPSDRFATATELGAALEPFELPAGDKLAIDLAAVVREAGDSKKIARQIKDSVDRMRAVAERGPPEPPMPESVPPLPMSGRRTAPASPAGLAAAERTLAARTAVRPARTVEVSRVRRTDGRVLENLSLPRLLELVATGELMGDDEVAFGDGAFGKIREHAELARHLLPSTTQTTRDLHAPGAPDYRSLLGDTPMIDVLAQMRRERESGALFVERADRTGAPQRKELYLRSGRLHHVASTDRSELLGEYLVRRHALTREQLDTALASLSEFGGRLGDTVVGLGYVQAVDIFRAIRDQGRDRVAALCGWTRGSAVFYRGTEPGHVEFPLDLDLASPMMAGAIVQTNGEPRALLPDGDTPLAPGPRHYAAFDPAEVGTVPISLRRVPELAANRVSVSEAITELTTPRPSARKVGEKEAQAALVAAKHLGWVDF